jgi:GNAT superfamily N-acetyltransferase
MGWVHATELDILESGRSCEIVGLVVGRDYGGQGIGRRLVDLVEQWAIEHRLKEVSVRSNATRTESHPFYERVGFVRVKTQHAYRKRIR